MGNIHRFVSQRTTFFVFSLPNPHDTKSFILKQRRAESSLWCDLNLLPLTPEPNSALTTQYATMFSSFIQLHPETNPQHQDWKQLVLKILKLNSDGHINSWRTALLVAKHSEKWQNFYFLANYLSHVLQENKSKRMWRNYQIVWDVTFWPQAENEKCHLSKLEES